MAISNSIQWILCFALVITKQTYGYGYGYRYHHHYYHDDPPTQVTPYYPGGGQPSNENWSRRSDGARSIQEDGEHNDDLEKEGRNFGSGPHRRSDNGSFKIVNVRPTLHNQRDSKDEDARPDLRDGILFPEPQQTRKSDNIEFVPSISEKCQKGGNGTLCDAVDNYPESYIQQLLHSSGDKYSMQFGFDELEPIKIAQRIGDPDEIELCSATEKVLLPRAGQNKDAKWVHIVNQQDDTHIQAIRIETCSSPDSACSPVVSVRLGLEATCKQKYAYRRMIVINQAGQIAYDAIRFPTCCYCSVRSVDLYPVRKKRTLREP